MNTISVAFACLANWLGWTGSLPVVDHRVLAGARILLLPRYTTSGPSSRMRMNQFIPMLRAAGAVVESSPFFDERYLDGLFGRGARSGVSAVRSHAGRFATLTRARADLVWVEKELFPFLPGTVERVLRWRGMPYVVDYDDAVFHRYDRHPCWAVRRTLGLKLDPLLKGAAAVTAGNDYLAAYASAHGARRVLKVPTVVDPRDYPLVPQPGGVRLRLGWIGTPHNSRYLGVVADALRLLADEVPVTLVTIGAPVLPDLPVPQEVHGWTAESETSLLGTIDAGVMPLPDSSYERGKCGYKLIQYMAAGRPVIGSPLPVNREIVTHDVGFLASTPGEWADAIRRLAADPALRARLGAAGRARVEAHYSHDVAAGQLLDLFAEILTGQR